MLKHTTSLILSLKLVFINNFNVYILMLVITACTVVQAVV